MFKMMRLVNLLMLLFIGSILCQYNSLSEGVKLPLGKQPEAVFYDKQMNCYNIFCNGRDTLFNYIIDPGDEAPSWWRLKINPTDPNLMFELTKIHTFEFSTIGWPFRPAIDEQNRVIYISQGSSVSAYNYDNGELITQNVVSISAAGLSIAYGKLFISERVWADGSGRVLVYDLTQKIITDTIPAYAYVQQTIPYGNNMLAILNEGNFGSNDSKIYFVKINETDFEQQAIVDVGGSANHILIHGDSLFVTNNASVRINVIDLNTYSIVDSILFSMDSWSGPRESFYSTDENLLYTSTYSGTLYISDPSTMKIVDSLPELGKADGIAVNQIISGTNCVVITNPLNQFAYWTDSTITIYIKAVNGVNDKSVSSTKSYIYPNPVNLSSQINIASQLNFKDNYEIRIVDESGNTCATIYNINLLLSLDSILPSILTIDLKPYNLAQGTYFIIIQNEKESQVVKFCVIN